MALNARERQKEALEITNNKVSGRFNKALCYMGCDWFMLCVYALFMRLTSRERSEDDGTNEDSKAQTSARTSSGRDNSRLVSDKRVVNY